MNTKIKRDMRNECYYCDHKRSVPGNCHIECVRPDKNMTGDKHGIREGWFMYPFLFDPVWKTSLCGNFEFHKSVNHAVSGAVRHETKGQDDQG